MVWLCATKILRKCKTLLYGYRQFHSSFKNRWCLQRYFRRFQKEIDRPLPIGKNEKLIGWTKDELGGKIMQTFVGLKGEACSYLKDNNHEGQKEKGTKKACHKKKY